MTRVRNFSPFILKYKYKTVNDQHTGLKWTGEIQGRRWETFTPDIKVDGVSRRPVQFILWSCRVWCFTWPLRVIITNKNVLQCLSVSVLRMKFQYVPSLLSQSLTGQSGGRPKSEGRNLKEDEEIRIERGVSRCLYLYGV